MARFDLGPDHDALLRSLRAPATLATSPPADIAAVMNAAQAARLLGWFVNQLDAQAAPSVAPPEWLADRLVGARALVDEYDREVRWEVNRLARAFRDSGIRWVLLKGAGYLLANLPPGRGRRVADIDILVPEGRLTDAERLLQEHGWEFPERDAYDEHYYRTWMHELPPMVHRDRGSIVDLHHNILPRTSRLRPSPARLIASAIEVGEAIHALSPAHMVLHAAAHLFHDGEISGAIRDLVDLDGLLRHFSRNPSFWPSLVEEARALDLTRPAYYAIHNANRILDTPVPAEVRATVGAWAPPLGLSGVMDRLVDRALSTQGGAAASLSNLALYIRSHWLRMPPIMLARHLFRKAVLSRPAA